MKRSLNYRKMIGWAIGLILLIVVGSVATIIGIDNYQYRRNQKIIQNLTSAAGSNALVVFYSRSGNTELMARKIAEIKHANVIPIQSERNGLGLLGWIQALQDARNTHAEISPSKIDLSSYDTIYLGSPIWLYSPAPPIFEFAKNNNFSGKKVVLFNSMNSKFEQTYIDDFKEIIENNGGTFLNHMYIIRGRMTQQMEVDTFLSEVEKLMK